MWGTRPDLKMIRVVLKIMWVYQKKVFGLDNADS